MSKVHCVSWLPYSGWAAQIIAGLILLGLVCQPDFASAQQKKKPNILVIWGDDVGVHNISTYNHGIMGYKTPNIDRIARDGAFFTDAYAQQSCTAGRASFILGQHPFRTGLLTIGMPGSDHGTPDWAPTIADLLKAEECGTEEWERRNGDRGMGTEEWGQRNGDSGMWDSGVAECGMWSGKSRL
jgi:hypothetical protein